MNNYYVLVDCNNFYVSCERLFNPHLEGKPVVVLSNNDGCVIARSNESKKLGIKMGDPFFKIKEFCRQRSVWVCSSNYQLYGDISCRINQVLSEMAPELEVYSIDEAFLKFSVQLFKDNIFSHCLEIRKQIKKLVGIPTSIGIAPTKTLAKVATDFAKKDPNGVYEIREREKLEEILKTYPIEDVWGVGSQFAVRLKALGIYTAWDLRESDPCRIRKCLGVVGEKVLWELRGTSCLPLDKVKPKKSIAYSRAFGTSVKDLKTLGEALSTYVANACQKLRKQGSSAYAMCIYVEAKNQMEEEVRLSCNKTIRFQVSTNDTAQLIQAAKRCLDCLYKEGQVYKKCGVILMDLNPESNMSPDLFMEDLSPKRRLVSKTVDALNERYGKHKVFYAAMGTEQPWKMNSERRSRRYTTSWNELCIVKC